MKKSETENKPRVVTKGNILLIRNDLKVGKHYRKTLFSKEMEPFKNTLIKVKKVCADGSFTVYGNDYYFTPEMVVFADIHKPKAGISVTTPVKKNNNTPCY